MPTARIIFSWFILVAIIALFLGCDDEPVALPPITRPDRPYQPIYPPPIDFEACKRERYCGAGECVDAPEAMWGYQCNCPAGYESINSTCSLPPTHEMPIVSMRFIPDDDQDGQVDPGTDLREMQVGALRQQIERLEQDTSKWMTESSRYKGFRNAEAKPYLGYRVVKSYDYTKSPPLGRAIRNGRRPDYVQILEDIDVCHWVEVQGVKEFWIWTHHASGLVPAESNLWSSYGDVSNSERTDDLPHCSSFYAVYNYNFTRGVAEALHNHGHHFEALLRYNDNDLFWTRFVGSAPSQHNLLGDPVRRCGWTHYAPNAQTDYETYDLRLTPTDCEDWQPDIIGPAKNANCTLWQGYFYGAPAAGQPPCRQDGGLAFYVWWMQNLPGQYNTLYHQGEKLRNWWDFIYDMENVFASQRFLYE